MKHGFSLIESVIVLLLVGVALSVIAFRPTTDFSPLEERIFFDQLRSELHYAQEVAILQQVPVRVEFDESGEVRFGNRQLDLPTDWQVQTPFAFDYLPNGHVSYFRTIVLEHVPTQHIRRIVMQIGSGQFEIK